MWSSSTTTASMALDVSIPLAVGVFGVAARLLTPRGGVAGVALGVAVIQAGYDMAAAMVLFFLAGSLVTKVGAKRKVGITPGEDGAPKKQDGPAPSHAKATTGRQRESEAKSESESAETKHQKQAEKQQQQQQQQKKKKKKKKKGRDEWQVLATAGVPALLCVLRHAGLPHGVWHTGAMAYFACSAGDTFASELGVLSRQVPVSILTLRPVRRGQDGGITFAGTLASILGGAVVGLSSAFRGAESGGQASGWWWLLAVNVAQQALWGGIGSSLDSVGGAVLQSDLDASHRDPVSWKRWNNIVNAGSSVATALVAVAVDARPNLTYAVTLSMALCLLAVAPVSTFLARKLLHIGTSVLVVRVASSRLLICTVAALTLVLLTTVRGLLSRFEAGTRSPGIAVFTAVTGLCAFAHIPIFTVLGPMMFADPLAAIVGRALPSPRLFGTSKTLVGSATFALVATACFALEPLVVRADPSNPFPVLGEPLHTSRAMLMAVALAVVELLSGSWDNLSLPVATVVLRHVLG